MSVKIVWDNAEKTIVRYIFGERYTWDEFEVAKRQHVEMMKEIEGPVGVILEYPPNMIPPIYALSVGKQQVSQRDPRNYLIVVATTSLIERALVGLFKRFYPKEGQDIILVPTLEEARALLKERYPHGAER